jgi:uncharacterized protein YprB with RNaseH-like and TPR domain
LKSWLTNSFYIYKGQIFLLLDQIKLENLLFLDIETVAGSPVFVDLDPQLQGLWLDRGSKIAPELTDMDQLYLERAALQAEFGKIICISAAYLLLEGDQYTLRIKTLSGDDEKALLTRFLNLASSFASRHRLFQFTGHNIREFDIPYICRRCLILGLELPSYLQFYGMRPWEVPVLDTLQLWRFGDSRHFAPLKLITAVLGIDSPKDDIDGSRVGEVYWQDHDLDRIGAYCRKDVVAVAQVLLRLKGKPLLLVGDIALIQ